MSIHLSYTEAHPRVDGVDDLLALTACTVTSDSDPVTDRSPATVAPDYVAPENAIETKIKSGSVGWDTVNAVMVSVEGQTVIAHYRNGQRPDQAIHVWSGTKSLTQRASHKEPHLRAHRDRDSDGVIESLDQNLPELLPNYRQHMTDAEAKVTLRQLMDMPPGSPVTSRWRTSGRCLATAVTRWR